MTEQTTPHEFEPDIAGLAPDRCRLLGCGLREKARVHQTPPTEQTICSDCRVEEVEVIGKMKGRSYYSKVRLCQRHASLEKLEAALRDIQGRALRIREDKAIVGVEAFYIANIAREALASTDKQKED